MTGAGRHGRRSLVPPAWHRALGQGIDHTCLGTLPVMVNMTRIALWPKSAVESNMHGHPPSITVIPCRRPNSVAAAETLPAPGAAMHPDVLDAELSALAHGVFGSRRPGADHHRLDTARHRLEVRVTPIALDLLGVRVDREHLVAAIPQPLVDDIAAMPRRRARDTGYRDSLLRQKVRCGLLHSEHVYLLVPVPCANGANSRFARAVLFDQSRTSLPKQLPVRGSLPCRQATACTGGRNRASVASARTRTDGACRDIDG